LEEKVDQNKDSYLKRKAQYNRLPCSTTLSQENNILQFFKRPILVNEQFINFLNKLSMCLWQAFLH
jgi:hypothetical protein